MDRTLRELLHDPLVVSVATAVAMVIAGFAAIAVGWRGAAAEVGVWRQVPYAVSGAIGGLGLVGLGLAVVDLQFDRRAAAREQDDLDALIRRASALRDARA